MLFHVKYLRMIHQCSEASNHDEVALVWWPDHKSGSLIASSKSSHYDFRLPTFVTKKGVLRYVAPITSRLGDSCFRSVGSAHRVGLVPGQVQGNLEFLGVPQKCFWMARPHSEESGQTFWLLFTTFDRHLILRVPNVAHVWNAEDVSQMLVAIFSNSQCGNNESRLRFYSSKWKHF